MEAEEYERLFLIEDSHWWFKSTHSFVLGIVDKFTKSLSHPTVLDAGCGTGGLINQLKSRSPNLNVFGVDVSSHAISFAKQRVAGNLSQASISTLPFPNNCFDLIVSIDVLYHSQVKDDIQAVREFTRVLKPNGFLLIQVPAFEFLRSSHDTNVHTARRYRKNELLDKLNDMNLEIIKSGYRFFFIFPFVALIKISKKYLLKSDNITMRSDLHLTNSIVNYFLFLLNSFESKLAEHINFPFGSSLYVVVRKNK